MIGILALAQARTAPAEALGHVVGLGDDAIQLPVEKRLLQLDGRLDVLQKGLFHGGNCDSKSPP